MRAEEVKRVAEREPFLPFGVRLSNGAQYFFNNPRDFGAPRDFTEIFYFAEDGGWALIDTENIVEILEKK